MELWIAWFDAVLALRDACARKRTFLWMTLVLVGFSIRDDLLGVSSFIRACLLKGTNYRRLLYLFHSPALNLHKLTALWIRLVMRLFCPVTFGDYLLLVADGPVQLEALPPQTTGLVIVVSECGKAQREQSGRPFQARLLIAQEGSIQQVETLP